MPSLKPLKSVAHSLAHHVASTLCYWGDDYAINHLAMASKRCHSRIVEIDLLAQTTSPTEIHAGVVAELLPYRKDYFFNLLAKESIAAEVVESVTLKYDFGVGRHCAFNLPTPDYVLNSECPRIRRFGHGRVCVTATAILGTIASI
ncbi:MAG: hypothetical protein V4631_16385 [Pseudomonadota bacterium]